MLKASRQWTKIKLDENYFLLNVWSLDILNSDNTVSLAMKNDEIDSGLLEKCSVTLQQINSLRILTIMRSIPLTPCFRQG